MVLRVKRFEAIYQLIMKKPFAVAGPGFFPRGVRQIPKVLLFFNFLPKTA